MILFTSSQVGEVLQRLYDSGINISISSDIADGFRPSIYADGRGSLLLLPSKSIMNVVDGLAFAAARDYPNSDFAKWYRSKDSNAKQMESSPSKGFFDALDAIDEQQTIKLTWQASGEPAQDPLK